MLQIIESSLKEISNLIHLITTYHKVSFNNKLCREFSLEVKRRGNAYFEEQGISKHANTQMVIKTIIH